ncbi:MAG: PTS sugar transporter subunit IIA [Candidatus Hydrogenedentes bacterium]|nr:PTS sugar transporter subunit IIA [Candidatus Hydrogenedentota bacterium]
MRLSSLLVPSHIVLGLRSRTLREATGELLRRVTAFHPNVPLSQILQALMARENQESTALESGIGLPHARIPSLNDFYVLLGIAAAPLEEKGIDAIPIDLVFLILASNEKHGVMLQAMAAIGFLAQESDRLQQIRQARTREAVWGFIAESGLELQKTLRARDLMRPVAATVQEDTLLGEALDLMVATKTNELPVCGSTGRVIATVSTQEILEAAFPHYLGDIHDITFLDDFEPVNQFFRSESSVRVREIQELRPIVVDPDAPILQVLFYLKDRHRHFAYVQDQSQLVGVIDRDEVIARVFRP